MLICLLLGVTCVQEDSTKRPTHHTELIERDTKITMLNVAYGDGVAVRKHGKKIHGIGLWMHYCKCLMKHNYMKSLLDKLTNCSLN